MRPGLRSRLTMLCKLPKATHMPKKTPSAVPMDQGPQTNGKPMANSKDAAPTQRNS